jgi:hypothetical protein
MDVEDSSRCLFQGNSPSISLEGLGKTTKAFSQEYRLPVKELNLQPPEFKEGMVLLFPYFDLRH